MSIDVRLPIAVEPVFPDRCVGCGAASPGRAVTLWAWRVPIWILLTGIALFFTKARRTRVPACRRCGWRLRFGRLVETAVMIALIVVGMYVAGRLTPGWPRIGRRVAMLVGGVVALVPWVWWHVRNPAAMDVTLEKDSVLYEFADPLYAMEFAARNNSDVVPL